MRLLDDRDRRVIRQRILKRVVIVGKCWEWTGFAQVERGEELRPVMRFQGRLYKVHRLVAWAWHGLDIYNSVTQANHECDNTLCVRPSHIYVGTQQDNIRDMHSRGRAKPWGNQM